MAGRLAKVKSLTVRGPLPTLSAPLRLRPSFFILGAKKAGTTALSRYLQSHDDIAYPYRKVLAHFDTASTYRQGLARYLANYPLRIGKSSACITGEATPYYLFHPHVPARLKATFPGARFLVLVRNPVDRAHSDYWHQVRTGREQLSFADAVAAEPDRIGAEWDRMLGDENYDSETVRAVAYLARGRYAEQLERWFAEFSRDRFLVYDSSELKREPERVCTEVFDFLGLAPVRLNGYPAYNTGTYDPMDPDLRARLVAEMAPHNERLFTLLGRRWSWDR